MSDRHFEIFGGEQPVMGTGAAGTAKNTGELTVQTADISKTLQAIDQWNPRTYLPVGTGEDAPVLPIMGPVVSGGYDPRLVKLDGRPFKPVEMKPGGVPQPGATMGHLISASPFPHRIDIKLPPAAVKTMLLQTGEKGNTGITGMAGPGFDHTAPPPGGFKAAAAARAGQKLAKLLNAIRGPQTGFTDDPQSIETSFDKIITDFYGG